MPMWPIIKNQVIWDSDIFLLSPLLVCDLICNFKTTKKVGAARKQLYISANCNTKNTSGFFQYIHIGCLLVKLNICLWIPEKKNLKTKSMEQGKWGRGRKLVSEPIVPYLTSTCDIQTNFHTPHIKEMKQKYSAMLYKIFFLHKTS